LVIYQRKSWQEMDNYKMLSQRCGARVDFPSSTLWQRRKSKNGSGIWGLQSGRGGC
jgi:hypothetical protein